MSKFVFFIYGEEYQKCLINALQGEKDVYYFDNFKSGLIKKTFFLHNAWAINSKYEMPFKRIWFERVMKGIEIEENESVYFVLYESFHLTYSRKFLKYLKQKYRNAKLCYVFSNPADAYNKKKVSFIEEYLDAIITFNNKDAITNHYLFCPLQPYKVPIYKPDSVEKSDLFFIGAEKGRLDKLISIYEHLSAAGVKCDFYIVGVPKEKQKYSDKIKYNQRLTYDEVLKKVASTHCVLEVLKNSENYVSIRTMEAMQYKTKLLTSNLSIENFGFYNKNIIQTFDSVEDINIEFLKNDPDLSLYPDETFGAFEGFKRYLIEHIE